LRVLLIAVILVAALLRFYRIDAQSFWNDEGNSARIAERSLGLIVEGAAGDVHPPGYYLLLHYWRGVLGQSEFALRSLSAAAGLILVGLTYLVGRRLFNEATGLIAAFLGAISPFAVYYSQEARMYALLGAIAALSMLVAIRVVQSVSTARRPGSGVVASLATYVAVNAAGLYTHYAFVFVVVAHNVFFAAWWLVEQRRRRPEGRSLWYDAAAWAGVQAAVILLYLPWLPKALGAAGWGSAGGGYDLGPALVDVLRVLTVGITLPLNEALGAVVAAGVLLLAGLGSWAYVGGARRREETWPGWASGALAIYLVVPLALFFGFDLYKPAWLKFLVVLLLPFQVLIARGVDSLVGLAARAWSRRGSAQGGGSPAMGIARTALCVLMLLPVVAATEASLRNLMFNPAYFRDDYRQIAGDIEGMRRPGDGIILNAPNQWEVFTYYYPDRDVYPAPYRPSNGQAERFLTPILQEHERLFVLYWGDAESDPTKRVESGLAERAYKAGDRWYGDVRLAMYGAASLPEEPHTRLDVEFGGLVGELAVATEGVMRLRGCALAERGPFDGGDIVPVTLFWEARRAVEEPYKVTLQLLDGAGRLSAQVDTVPGDGLSPTTLWQAGQEVVDRYGILVPEDLAPGRYSIIVAVYHAVTGERLGARVGGEEAVDHVVLSDVLVASP